MKSYSTGFDSNYRVVGENLRIFHNCSVNKLCLQSLEIPFSSKKINREKLFLPLLLNQHLFQLLFVSLQSNSIFPGEISFLSKLLKSFVSFCFKNQQTQPVNPLEPFSKLDSVCSTWTPAHKLLAEFYCRVSWNAVCSTWQTDWN